MTSDEVESLDLKTANAVDGVGGGAYAPSTQIEIGGKGLKVTGPCSLTSPTISGTLSVVNLTVGVNPGSDLVVNATTTLHAALICNSTATFNAAVTCNSTLAVAGNATIGGTLGVTGDATFSDDVSIGDDLDVGDDITAGGTVNSLHLVVNDNTTLGSSSNDTLELNASLISRMRFSGSGRVPWRHGSALPDASVTRGVGDGNIFRIPHNATATRVITLSTSGAQNGDFMRFYAPPNIELNAAWNIDSAEGGQDFTFGSRTAANPGHGESVDYVFFDGGWYRCGRGGT